MLEKLYIILSVVFWAASLLIVHTYVVYPLLISLLAKGRRLPSDNFENDTEFPEVVTLMAVHNEEAVLEATLTSIFASDYPAGKLRVLIGSDGSTDQSHAIIKKFQQSHPELELIIFSGRNGKIPIVNQLAIEASKRLENPESAAFVLCDANVTWTTDMLRNSVRHFKRKDVGLVGASVVDIRGGLEGIRVEEDSYILRENLIKYRESVLWGSAMGAFGACYVVRAELFRRVPSNYFNDDFFQTMSCLEQGYKAIVDIDAICNEAVSEDIQQEFSRKRRIAIGNFQNLESFRDFLSPWVGGWRTWFSFWSHKGLRWIGPLLLVSAFLSCFCLGLISPIYWVPFSVLIATLVMSGIDLLQSRYSFGKSVSIFRFVRYFYWMNSAVVLGFLSFSGGVKDSIWEPTHRVGSERSAAGRKGGNVRATAKI